MHNSHKAPERTFLQKEMQREMSASNFKAKSKERMLEMMSEIEGGREKLVGKCPQGYQICKREQGQARAGGFLLKKSPTDYLAVGVVPMSSCVSAQLQALQQSWTAVGIWGTADHRVESASLQPNTSMQV